MYLYRALYKENFQKHSFRLNDGKWKGCWFVDEFSNHQWLLVCYQLVNQEYYLGVAWTELTGLNRFTSAPEREFAYCEKLCFQKFSIPLRFHDIMINRQEFNIYSHYYKYQEITVNNEHNKQPCNLDAKVLHEIYLKHVFILLQASQDMNRLTLVLCALFYVTYSNLVLILFIFNGRFH